MNRIFELIGAWLLVGAVPALAQDPGQAASGMTAEPAKPDQPATGGAVQINVAPLIRSLIKRATRSRPKPVVQAAEQVPEKPAEAVPAATAAAPPYPPAPAATVATASEPTLPVTHSNPAPRPRSVAIVAQRPSRSSVPSVDTPPVVVSGNPGPAAPSPPLATPRSTNVPASVADPSLVPVAPALAAASLDPVQQPDRTWPLAAMLALLAVAVAATGIVIRHGRLIRRTRLLLRLEPRLDLGRGRCAASGLVLASGSDG